MPKTPYLLPFSFSSPFPFLCLSRKALIVFFSLVTASLTLLSAGLLTWLFISLDSLGVTRILYFDHPLAPDCLTLFPSHTFYLSLLINCEH